jgi:hypothetical protein
VIQPAANPVGNPPDQIDRRASTEVFMSKSTCSHVRGLLFLSCRISKRVCEVGGAVLLHCVFAPALAQPSNGPPIAREIERRFEGFYLFTTKGGGESTVYQRVDDGLGLNAADAIVCMPRECFLEIARVPDAALQRPDIPRKVTEPLREHLRVLRDAYSSMKRASPAERPQAMQNWREAMAGVGRCLRDHAC